MSLSIFPDLNVWLALSVPVHERHRAAWSWYRSLRADDRLFFCRFTQMGLLRLLSQEAVMGAGEALNQPDAWKVYDRWLTDFCISFYPEPETLEPCFRQQARSSKPAPKSWGDDYLCAFSQAAGLQLATMDRPLSRRAVAAILIV
ncbi:MAG TPA: TA system VapC family ribonuclease toxin [Terriglobales bacterium]|nr:TA system VapC family ribonuclease toxin [Terriglobales bacterium]